MPLTPISSNMIQEASR